MKLEGLLLCSQEPNMKTISSGTRIQYTLPEYIYISSILILNSYLRLSYQVISFLHDYRLKSSVSCLIAPMRATCLSSLTLLPLITPVTRNGSWNSVTCGPMQSADTFVFRKSQYASKCQLSKTLSWLSYGGVKYQVLHSHKQVHICSSHSNFL
jgi:hypothetical protein